MTDRANKATRDFRPIFRNNIVNLSDVTYVGNRSIAHKSLSWPASSISGCGLPDDDIEHIEALQADALRTDLLLVAFGDLEEGLYGSVRSFVEQFFGLNAQLQS